MLRCFNRSTVLSLPLQLDFPDSFLIGIYLMKRSKMIPKIYITRKSPLGIRMLTWINNIWQYLIIACWRLLKQHASLEFSNELYFLLLRLTQSKCNFLVYLNTSLFHLKTNLIIKYQRPYSQHIIFLVTYKCAQQAMVFVPVKPFQPSVM
jgi:hypothetical protein